MHLLIRPRPGDFYFENLIFTEAVNGRTSESSHLTCVYSFLQKNIFVADLTEEMVTTPAQALAWISKGESKVLFFCCFFSDLHIPLAVKSNMYTVFWWCLENRHYGKTKMNQRSSRSHTIFRMVRSTVYQNMWVSMDFSWFCLFCFFKILESRERSDPASGENADGAIIVSHLVSLFILLGGFRVTLLGRNYLSVKLYILSIFASFHLEFSWSCWIRESQSNRSRRWGSSLMRRLPWFKLPD